MKDSNTYPEINSKCETCIFYLRKKECAAFEVSIPEEIWDGSIEHDKVIEGQETSLIYVEHGKPL